MDKDYIKRIVEKALEEDVGEGDVTTNSTVPEERTAKAVIYSKERGIICGLEVAEMVFISLDPGVKFRKLAEDGDSVEKNQDVAEIEGKARALLTGERTALNFLQRLSGISTTAKRYADAVKPHKVRILDTRKTTPGLRKLEKYAVKMGGCSNHRMGLYDAVLIKDNHTEIAGLKEAVERARKTGKVVEVEVESTGQAREAVSAGADVIMLDNMSPGEAKEAVKAVKGRAKTEISGGISLENIREYAETGTDWISVGRLTHSVRALDLAMRTIL